jgi:hypothetical protein
MVEPQEQLTPQNMWQKGIIDQIEEQFQEV